MASNVVANKPHAICIPVPFQSHIKAMLNLAKILHQKGFHITFVNTEFNHERLIRSRGPDSMKGLPDFRFEAIPDGLPPSDPGVSQDITAICRAILEKKLLAPFSNLLAKLNDTERSNVPPVTCILSDVFMSAFTVTAAEEVGIPIALLVTASACSFMCITEFRSLKERGLFPLKDESFLTNGFLDTIIDWIPGMPGIRFRDLPALVRSTDPEDFLVEFCSRAAERALKTPIIVFHTFHALEKEVLTVFSSMFRHVYSVGPLQLQLKDIQYSDDLDSIGYNLWKEETECLQWLDSKQPNKVIYVNFGSLIIMTKQQLTEFAMGLAKSNYHFLWIIRPDLVVGESAVLPAEFTEETRDRSFIGSWCPQEEVLNHPSVGGFITHCGWNSILESISSAVPMLCWPCAGDQPTNCHYVCYKWGIGMEIDCDVKREGVDNLVRELMDGEKGKEMKKKAVEWKHLVEEATRPGGSSSVNLDKLVTELGLSI